ncbi:hypothetical protein ACWEQG_24855 [Microbispora sp. NPDC004025]
MLRLLALVGYPTGNWLPDSFDYVHLAVERQPGLIRPNGYSFFLGLLAIFGGVPLILVIQHLLSLGTTTVMYALLRRKRLPDWGATLACLPMLYEPRQLFLEHSILSEAVFTPCLVLVAVLLLWRTSPTRTQVIAAGLCLAAAALVRPVVLPILILATIYVVSRSGRRAAVALTLSCLLPLAAYGVWFHSEHGRYGLSSADGLILWSRVMSFADCARVEPPPRLAALCPRRDTRRMLALGSEGNREWPWNLLLDRRQPVHYLVDPDGWPSTTPGPLFSPEKNDLARDFALRAITAQPVDYLLVTLRDIGRTFYRADMPIDSGQVTVRFHDRPEPMSSGAAAEVARLLGEPLTQSQVEPFAMLIRQYQDRVYLGSVGLTVLFAAGLAGLAVRRRRNGAALFCYAAATVLFLLPPAINEGEYRFATPAIPLACMALALLFRPSARTDTPLPPPTAETPSVAGAMAR